MEATCVTFEQAKWLKESGFDEFCNASYRPGDNVFQKIPSQNSLFSAIAAPEQWQVVEWLRVNHGIWVTSNPLGDEKDWVRWDYKILDLKNPNCSIDYEVSQLTKGYEELIKNSFNSPQQAYSAAFDYIKDKKLI